MTPYLPPPPPKKKKLGQALSSVSFRTILLYPEEIEYNGHAKFWGVNKVFYGQHKRVNADFWK